jgi:hypothetical protein
MTGAMSETARRLVRSLTTGRFLRAFPEIALYAAGAGVLFFIVDILLVRWQGLSLD